jgi:hypothetical protein
MRKPKYRAIFAGVVARVVTEPVEVSSRSHSPQSGSGTSCVGGFMEGRRLTVVTQSTEGLLFLANRRHCYKSRLA